MRIYLTFCIIVTVMTSSCEKQEEVPFRRDANGIIISMPYLWKTSLSTRGTLIDGLIENDISYDGNVLLPIQDGEQSKMAMLSSATGKILWEWNDLYEIDKDFHIVRQYQYGKYLAFQHGFRFYTIDLSNGSTIKKEQREYVAGSISGIRETIFIAGDYVANENNHYEGNVYVSKLNSQEHALLISPAFSREHIDGNNTTGAIGSAVAFKDEAGNILITYDFADVQPEWRGNLYVGLYNYTKQEPVYEKQPLALDVNVYAGGPAVIYEGKAYYAPAKSIVCIDILTGNRIWKKDFSEGFAFSGYIIANDKLIANCEDTWLYALDPETGRELWKEKSSGTSSKMGCLNGVVYFKGGGDGLLHAVEIETGKHLWKIHSPDLEVNSGAWFMPRVSVLPPAEQGEKGKVVVSSYLSAFCYEAAR